MTSLPPDGIRRKLGPTATAATASTPTANYVEPEPGSMNLPGIPATEEEALALVQAAMAAEARAQNYAKWANWVDTEYQNCRNARHPFERQWFINLAFYQGKQYVAPINVPGMGFRLAAPTTPNHRVRMVINKIRPAIRTECAKLTSSKPIPVVVPATNEDEDYAAANVAEAILRADFGTERFNADYLKWVWWGSVTGISYLKQWWDPASKDYDSFSLPPAPMMPDPTNPGQTIPMPPEVLEQLYAMRPDYEEYMNTPQPAQGKIRKEAISPFHIFVPDMLVESINEQPYVIHVMTKSPLWVKNMYPDAFPGDEMPATDALASNTIMDSVSLFTKGMNAQQANATTVKEAWIKPGTHPDFPEGGLVTVVNQRVVQVSEKWPLESPKYPFYEYRGIPTGGYYPDSVIVDLLPVQKEYNKKRSQAIEIMNVMGKPRLVYPKGSIDPRKISSEVGQSVGYTPGYDKPEVMQGVEIPNSFIQEMANLVQEFDDISGQHDISRGSAPSDIRSGTALTFLAEQDDSKLSYQVASIEGAIQSLGGDYLKLASKYWEADRIVKVAGKNNAYESYHWKENALKGNTDVRIETGSALPVSKAARMAQIVEFMQNGFLAPEDGMEMLRLGGFDKILDGMLADKRQAQRENLKMATLPEKLINLFLVPPPGPNGEVLPDMPNPEDPMGKPLQMTMDPQTGEPIPFNPTPPVPVNSWDNHEQHILWHNNFRKTQEFEVLPEANKKAFEIHVQMHQAAIMSTLMNQRGATLGGEPQPPPQTDEEGNPIEDPSGATPEEDPSKPTESTAATQ